MSIKGGDLITIGGDVLIDRIQNAGPGQVNIPIEKVFELGNYQSVGTVLDIPDLTFPCESLDVSAEMEAMLVGRTPAEFAADADGTLYDLSTARPIDVAQQFKAGKTSATPFDVIGSVALPYLALESVSYRFGLRENAAQTVTWRGDSIIYSPGSTYIQETPGTNTANQIVGAASTPKVFYDTVGAADLLLIPNGDDVIGGTRYVLGVTLVNSGKRLIKGSDYSEQVSGAGATKTVTITVFDPVPVDESIRVIFSSDTVATYPQNSHAVDSALRPSAIRGRNIGVFVEGVALTDRWTGVQSANADYRVTLDRDEEFGNSNVVGQDFDVPEVTGSIEFKPRDPAELLDKVRQVSGVGAGTVESVGALRRVPLNVDIVLYSPTSGVAIKTLRIPDARFTVPGYSGRVQQKLTVTFNYESDGGQLLVYKGVAPAP